MQYLTYITTAAAQFPAAIVTYVVLENIGRRNALCFATLATGITLLGIAFMPPHHAAIIRAMLFVAMLAESSALNILFVYTVEVWPTQLRNTLTNICGMFGSAGAMLAPLVILLVRVRIIESNVN